MFLDYGNYELQKLHRKSQHVLITILGARGAWTQSNRDMAFSLYDSWRRAHILRDQVNHLFVLLMSDYYIIELKKPLAHLLR